jgi:hypothetical protein
VYGPRKGLEGREADVRPAGGRVRHSRFSKRITPRNSRLLTANERELPLIIFAPFAVFKTSNQIQLTAAYACALFDPDGRTRTPMWGRYRVADVRPAGGLAGRMWGPLAGDCARDWRGAKRM